MNENYNKYRLVLSGLLVYQYTPEVIKQLIREWVEASGVKNVASGKIKAELQHHMDAVVYTAYFDSSYWTGIDFKGFDHKEHFKLPL